MTRKQIRKREKARRHSQQLVGGWLELPKAVSVEFPPREPWWIRLFKAFHISARSW